ncbi:MAG: DUF4362 domain-containing protein [Clostridiaceae bacterium]|nr:DUF4362 domain-containing protein [Clostridiaceae bacterium]
MKKKILFIIITIFTLVLLSACEEKKYEPSSYSSTSFSDKKESGVLATVKKNLSEKNTRVFDKLKSGLLLIPKEYSIDNAIKDGYFVVLNEEVKSKIEIIDQFVSDSQNKKATSITIVQYNLVGNPIIIKIFYDGIKYYVIEDDTRVPRSDTKYFEFEFKYLNVSEDNNRKKYLLLNDKGINYDQYMRSMLSSNYNDHIEGLCFCSYKN